MEVFSNPSVRQIYGEIEDRARHFWHEDTYGKLLLILLALTITCASIAGTTVGFIVSDMFIFLVSFVIAHSFFRHHTVIYRLYVLAALAASTLDAIGAMSLTGEASKMASIISAVSYAGLILLAILVISRRLGAQRKVNIDTVRGGICVYLLLAYLWYIFYAVINQTNVDAFQINVHRKGSYDLLYFSFCTITTLGYGDIVPLHRMAMVMANLEAVIGQMYPAVFIARLVSLYVVGMEREEIEVLKEEVEEVEEEKHHK